MTTTRLTPELRAHYKQGEEWANVRRRVWRYYEVHVDQPAGTVHIGSKVSATFTDDLLTLGWRPAILLNEENIVEATR